jgi:hypothetical protein
MAMMKARKPKRYASGGIVDNSNFPRVSNMPRIGYVGGVSPEHTYFQKGTSLAAQGAAPAAATVDPNNFIGDFSGGGGGASGGGAAGDSSPSSSDSAADAAAAAAAPSGDAGSGADAYRRGGAVRAKKMAKGGAVKSKMGRGDGCAMRGKTKGRMV